MFDTGPVWFRIHFAGVQLLEMPFGVKYSETKYVYPPGHPTVDYTTTLFCQLVLIFTALNMIGVLLAAFTYKLTSREKLKSTIAPL